MARKGDLSEQQWEEIRILWISTDRSNSDLAREFGVGESAIRNHAKRFGWGQRNAAERKRVTVAARMAGANHCASLAHRTPLDAETDQDVSDMVLSSEVGRLILLRCRNRLERYHLDPKTELPNPDDPVLVDPKDLKATADAARSAMEMIRRARGLDAPAPPPSPETSKLEMLAASLGRAREALACI